MGPQPEVEWLKGKHPAWFYVERVEDNRRFAPSQEQEEFVRANLPASWHDNMSYTLTKLEVLALRLSGIIKTGHMEQYDHHRSSKYGINHEILNVEEMKQLAKE